MPPRNRPQDAPQPAPAFDPTKLAPPVLIAPVAPLGPVAAPLTHPKPGGNNPPPDFVQDAPEAPEPDMEQVLGDLGFGTQLASEPPPDPNVIMEDFTPPIEPAHAHPPPAAAQVTEPAAVLSLPPLAPEPHRVQGGVVRYEQRIRLVEAYCFDGRLFAAPEWVDRNWQAYDDGPVLIVIDPRTKDALGVIRKGDYVVRQNVTVDDPTAPDGVRVLPSQMAVMPAAEFDRLYRAYVVHD